MIKKIVRRELANLLEIPEVEIKDDMSLLEIGADSLDRTDLALRMEEALDFPVDESKITEDDTVPSISKYLTSEFDKLPTDKKKQVEARSHYV